jgi:hypothetical protein
MTTLTHYSQLVDNFTIFAFNKVLINLYSFVSIISNHFFKALNI